MHSKLQTSLTQLHHTTPAALGCVVPTKTTISHACAHASTTGMESYFDFDTELSEQNAQLVKRELKVSMEQKRYALPNMSRVS